MFDGIKYIHECRMPLGIKYVKPTKLGMLLSPPGKGLSYVIYGWNSKGIGYKIVKVKEDET